MKHFDMAKVVFAALSIMNSTSGTSQVPPPPSSNGEAAAMNSLITAIQQRKLSSYLEVLDDNVIVFDDNKLKFSNKRDWKSYFQPFIENKGISYSIVSAYPRNGQLLTTEYFNSSNSWGGRAPADCCRNYYAVLYVFKGEKVVSISRLSGGERDIMKR